MSEEATPDIAIVGLAARYPGAADAARFWENLRDGVESIATLTDEELLAAGVDPAHLADPRYVRAKGVLAGADRFDAGFFGFTPREAEAMDPQHRVFLECAWEALEDAGCDPSRFAGRIGVWAGAGVSSYLIANLLPASERLEGLGGLQVLVLNDRDFLATRASFALDLKGPSAVVQTACSTSLYAAHLACQSLLAGECDLALAGGVAISVPLAAGYLYEPGSVLSPDGHCRAFDARAAGSVEGNGCGIVVLRRLGDALAAGDRIYAVIRGTAVNNDGAAKVGFTAPSVAGQTEVISESLMMADVPPETIGYVEAHGSGTPLGDPIEIAALTQAFRAAGAEGAGFCAVGSAKTAIGHCNTAAGAAGLIKTALALAHRTIPPSLHFETPNPEIDLAASPFYVPTAARLWEADGAPRRAGVSSFGLGGTNVHMVLEEAPEAAPVSPPARPAELLILSARTAPALDAAAGRLADYLEAQADHLDARGLADAAWTLQAGRRAFEHRRAVVARDREGAVRALRAGGAIEGRAERGKARPVVFLFPGLGDQRAGMARELYASEPVFRAEVDRAAAKLLPILGTDLREILFPAGAVAAVGGGPDNGPDLRALLRRDAAPESPEDARLRRTRFAQPACFIVEHALGRLLMSWGMVPQALLGYSVGEYVAATLSGSLDLDDALSLVALRAKLIDDLPGGAMLAVPLPGAELASLLGPDLSLAATNGPHFSVAAGPDEAVDELARRLAARGVATVRLRTTHAFHSAAMEPAVEPLARAARGIAMRPPRIPWISNLTGTWIAAADLADPIYWVRHMRGTVRFAEGLAELLLEPDRAFVEVGPGATLGTLVQQHPRAAAPLTVATLGRAEEGGSDLDALLAAVGRLWAAGVPVDWARFQGIDGGHRRRKAALPTYPFERQRYWIEPSPAAHRAAPVEQKAADLADWFWVPSWTSLPVAPVGQGRVERWLVFLDTAGLGDRLAALLRARGQEVATVSLDDAFANLGGGAYAVGPRRADYEALFHHLADEGGAPERIVHLGGLTAGEPAFEQAHASGLSSLLLLAQAVSGASGTGPIRLALVGNGLAQVLDGDPVHPAKAAALGAIKVVHQELPRLAATVVDAALPADGPGRDRLVGQIVAEVEAIGEGTAVVALRGRRRFVHGFAPLHLAESEGEPGAPCLRADGVYLVAGAAHGPGMAIAGHLVRHGAHVGLLLPGDFPSRGQWETWTAPAGTPPEQDAIGTAIRQLLDLDREVGLDRTLLLRADDPAAAGRAVAETTARFGPLSGAFWAGGAFASGLLQLKTPESLAAALQPAMHGAEALLDALDAAAASGADGAPRPFAVLCSTTTALSGGVGQLELAAAGAHLEALAARRAASGAPVVAVHWDPYQWGSWLAAGVAGGMSNLSAEEIQAGLRAHGVEPARSAAALDRLLGNIDATASPAVAVTARDLPSLLAEVDAVTADTLLAQMAAGHAEKASRPALATPFAPPKDELEERIAAIWQDLFGIEPIGRDDSFLELGGHSLLAIQIVTQIRQALDADLPVTALFEAPTVAELGKAVRQARGESDADELDALLALVEGLSAEEAAERLAEI